jgi:hypothetical protein
MGNGQPSLLKGGKMITTFILSVVAGVVANFISKWLDGKKRKAR